MAPKPKHWFLEKLNTTLLMFQTVCNFDFATQIVLMVFFRWTEEEMVILLTSLHPKLNQASAKMITYFFSLEHDNRDVRHRPATVRDLLKWCQRCDTSEEGLKAEDLVLEGKIADNGRFHLFNIYKGC